jgi:hypothetical protein
MVYNTQNCWTMDKVQTPGNSEHNEGICDCLFCMCLVFQFSIFDLVRCHNGITFRMMSYVLFLSFLSGPTKLVRVTGLQMLQRQKYGQTFVMFVLSADVAE